MPGIDPHPDVDCEDAAGDGCEPADHERHKLGAGHTEDVGTDHQGRFSLAHEDVGRRRECLRPGGAQRAAHCPRKNQDNLLQDAQVVEHRHDG